MTPDLSYERDGGGDVGQKTIHGIPGKKTTIGSYDSMTSIEATSSGQVKGSKRNCRQSYADVSELSLPSECFVAYAGNN